MPRQSRIDAPGALRHVVSKGSGGGDEEAFGGLGSGLQPEISAPGVPFPEPLQVHFVRGRSNFLPGRANSQQELHEAK
jgi:hypothetical protein